MNKKVALRILLVLAILIIFGAVKYYELDQYLTFDYFKQQRRNFLYLYEASPVTVVGIFMAIYILVAALSIPGVTVLTVGAGSLFGLGWGTIIVSFASTLGAVCAFLVCRFLLQDFVERRFSDILTKINKGIIQEGNSYLFALRLVPLFPFFVINAVVGLTRMNVFSFYWVSQIGMLPGTLLYVNVGRELSTLDSLSNIISFRFLLSFALLGIFPLVMKRLISSYRSAKIYNPYRRHKPKIFDYNAVVIGAGSGGLSAAYVAAAVKAKVALVEKSLMGGDCLNTGCVPSKALIRSAKSAHEMKKKAGELGLEQVKYKVNFPKVMSGVRGVVKKVATHDSVERYTKLGVDCISDEAMIKTPWSVELKYQKKTITTRNIIIATGAVPLVPSFPGLKKIKYLTSDNLWKLKKLPKNLLVLGGGPIGCEMAQSFQRLGSTVTQLEMDRIMGVEDPQVSKFIANKLRSEGVKVLEDHMAKEFIVNQGKKFIVAEHEGKAKKIQFDEVIIALGRRARVEGYGLERLRVPLRTNKTIASDDFLRTSYSNIFVCGDVTGPYQLTHAAGYQAWVATVNALFGSFMKFKVNYSVLPWCTFTDPEVASVGINETKAKKMGIAYEVSEYGLNDLDRAITDRSDEGFVRVITSKGKDNILGATVVGVHADLLLLEFIAGMKHRFGLNKILSTAHIYPSMGEANKYVAGIWRKAHLNPGLMKWVGKFHRWVRKEK